MTKEILFESIADFASDEHQAYRFGKRKHDDTHAVRRHSGEAYWAHPEGVAKIAKAYDLSHDEIIAAMLHDTMEDAGVEASDIEEKFGPNVAQLVTELSNDTEWISKIGKEAAMNQELLQLSSSALNVKLCDFYYNYMDSPSKEQKERMRKNLNYLKNNRKLTDTQADLVEDCLTA